MPKVGANSTVLRSTDVGTQFRKINNITDLRQISEIIHPFLNFSNSCSTSIHFLNFSRLVLHAPLIFLIEILYKLVPASVLLKTIEFFSLRQL